MKTVTMDMNGSGLVEVIQLDSLTELLGRRVLRRTADSQRALAPPLAGTIERVRAIAYAKDSDVVLQLRYDLGEVLGREVRLRDVVDFETERMFVALPIPAPEGTPPGTTRNVYLSVAKQSETLSWIVGELFPRTNVSVLVTVRDAHGDPNYRVCEATWDGSRWHMAGGARSTDLVSAWMPKPAPFIPGATP